MLEEGTTLLAMDKARELQIEMFRQWSPARRLEAAAQLIDLAVALRDARVRGELSSADDNRQQSAGHVPVQ